jgi:hypothetical protein
MSNQRGEVVRVDSVNHTKEVFSVWEIRWCLLRGEELREILAAHHIFDQVVDTEFIIPRHADGPDLRLRNELFLPREHQLEKVLGDLLPCWQKVLSYFLVYII